MIKIIFELEKRGWRWIKKKGKRYPIFEGVLDGLPEKILVMKQKDGEIRFWPVNDLNRIRHINYLLGAPKNVYEHNNLKDYLKFETSEFDLKESTYRSRKHYLGCGGGNYEYLVSRGLVREVLDRFGAGRNFKSFSGGKKIIFPLYLQKKYVSAARYSDFLKGFVDKGTRRGASYLFCENWRAAKDIFIFESPIDALSHAQIFPEAAPRIYLCTCGSLGQNVMHDILRLSRKYILNLSFDNDEAGLQHHHKLVGFLRKRLENDLFDRISNHPCPSDFKDFNDYLRSIT